MGLRERMYILEFGLVLWPEQEGWMSLVQIRVRSNMFHVDLEGVHVRIHI